MGTATKATEQSMANEDNSVDEYAAPAIVKEQALLKDWAART